MAFPITSFQGMRTPFYYYDIDLLDQTLDTVKGCLQPDYHVHYAIKACTNPEVLRHIRLAGFGCDCVSGGEIQVCLDAGFSPGDIVFAGVGKSDWEIELALRAGIFCFNVESIPELEIISQLARKERKKANVAFRINPNVGAHTHANITTGLAENKFGIDMQDMETVIRLALGLPSIQVIGLHFHIGSQLLEMNDFEALCVRINELQNRLEAEGIHLSHINVGGGLGIDYLQPDQHPIPDFRAYFDTYKRHLRLRPGQQLHFELGRSIVGQCGSLITSVLYVKTNAIKQFCIVDAGMTELLRPALYGSLHHIENLTSQSPQETYDVVGPICESSDVFAKSYLLPKARRGDLLAIRSAGAYGETMSSNYNCRRLPQAYTSKQLKI